MDGERDARVTLSASLRNEGYRTLGAANASSALKALETEPFDFILMDSRLRDVDGVVTMREIRKTSPFVPVVMMAESASVRDAVDAVKLGAYDYLAKPLDVEEVKVVIGQAMRYYGLKKEKEHAKKHASRKPGFTDIIGESPAMKELFETLSLVGPSDASALIYGETGTGKEARGKCDPRQ